jgi:parallel beta-helix repeat protein
MRKQLSIAVLLAVTTVALAAQPALAGSSHGNSVRCGQVITRDTRLSKDLMDCPGTALIIGADGVDLDLGGHVVDGVNAPGSEGIAVDGHKHVTIVNGTVRDFRVNGVAFTDSAQGRVCNLTIRRIGAGGVEGEDVSAGIFAIDSAGLKIEGNRVSNDVDAWQSDGIVVLGSPGAELTRNDSRHNAWNGIVVADSPNAKIVANRTVGNENSGILIAAAPSVVVARNYSAGHRNEDTGGIVLLATEGGRVLGNRLSDNASHGISIENGSTGTKVTGNRISGGGDGIALLDSPENSVAWNRIAGAGFAGIYASEGSDRNALDGNFVTRSAEDGIFVEGAANRLSRNTVTFNGRRGIEAVAGTVDGGGNRAFGNALSPQCADVSCRGAANRVPAYH